MKSQTRNYSGYPKRPNVLSYLFWPSDDGHEVAVIYSHRDQRRVMEIVHDLQHNEIEVWTDQCIGAEEISASIDRALARAKVVVGVFSKNAVESPWLYSEALCALEKDKFIAVSLDNTPLPKPLNVVRAIDFRAYRPGSMKGFGLLLREIRRRLR